MRKRLNLWIPLVLAVALSGGLVGCGPSRPTVQVREAKKETPAQFTPKGDADAKPAEEGSTALVPWQEFFSDPHLLALIGQALDNNQELNILVQEIAVANAEVLARRGEPLPRLEARAGAGIEKVGEYTSQGASDEAHGLPQALQDDHVGFFATWEVDIWKRMRNATKAAVFRYLASIEGRRFMVTRLVAEIARSYFELMALDNQLKVLDTNIELQTKALEALRLQKEAARATELAVQRFEAELLKIRSRRFDTLQKITETENTLNFLVGRFPQPVVRDAEAFPDLEPRAVHSGLPTELLANRPDIREAELALKAAELDVQVAKALFYPSLSIEAGVGYQAYDGLKLLATPESLLANLFGHLTMPLLNRMGLEAGHIAATAKQMQAVYRYEQTLLGAFTEVANQLSMIKNLAKSYVLRSRQVDRLNRSIDISTGLFRSARADYLEVLTARREALEARMELIETKLKQMNAMVNVYQALGGGWRDQTDAPAEQATAGEPGVKG